MLKFNQLPLRILVPVVTVLAAIVAASGTFQYNVSQSIKQAEKEKVRSVSRNIIYLQGLLNNLLLKGNHFEIQKIISSAGSDPYIIYSMVVDDSGKIISSSSIKFSGEDYNVLLDPKEESILQNVSVKKQGVTVISEDGKNIFAVYPLFFQPANGNLRNNRTGFYIEKHDFSRVKSVILENEEKSSLVGILFYLGSFFLIGVFFYFKIIQRVNQITGTAVEFADGNVNARTNIDSSDELGKLAKSIDYMIERISSSRKSLKETNEELLTTVNFLNEYMKVIDESTIVSKSDIEGNIIYVNDEFCRVTEYTREELIGMPYDFLKHPDTPSDLYREIREKIKNKEKWRGLIPIVSSSGKTYHTDTTVMPIIDSKGRIVEFITLRNDVTELEEKRNTLKNIHETDMLTGYGNRMKLMEDLKEVDLPAIAQYNIDNFQEINDFFGYVIGDQILCRLGNLLEEKIRDHGYRIYRLTGDEYALLGSNIHDRNEFITNIEFILLDISRSPFEMEDLLIPIQLSAGISFDQENILITADMALKRAKKSRVNIGLYDDTIDISELYKKNMDLTHELKKAIKDDRLIPYYQPIMNNSTEKIEKYESLMRMVSEDGRIIPPMQFIEIAKKAKLYTELTRIIFKKSLDEFKNNSYEFSVNLSLEDMKSPTLIKYILENLKENPQTAKRMVVEIVESEEVEMLGEVFNFILELKTLGTKIAIDDFGTGYSNFEYLLKLDPDYIKIDGSLIRNIDTNLDARSLVETIISFAKKRNIKTIAEYVHSREVHDISVSLGIDFSQGYFMGEPAVFPDELLIK